MMRLGSTTRRRAIALTLGLVLLGASAGVSQTARSRGVAPVIQVQEPERGWMGVNFSVTLITDQDRRNLNANEDRVTRALIRVVGTVSGGPAAVAGVVPGDVISRINGERLTLEVWNDLLRELDTGDDVRIGLDNRGRHREVHLTAIARPRLMPVSERVANHLDSVRESFSDRLVSSRSVWQSRAYVEPRISKDSLRMSSRRILDQARRNVVSYRFRTPTAEAAPDITITSVPRIAVEVTPAQTQAGRTLVWAFGGASVRSWSRSGSALPTPSVGLEVGVVAGYSFQLRRAQAALPFEYLLLNSPEADSVKTAIIRLRGELHVITSAADAREAQLVDMLRLQARELGRNDRELNRLMADNDRVSGDLSRLAVRLDEIGSREREQRERIVREASGIVILTRPLTARIVGRNFVGGAQFSELNPGLSEYFQADHGVLVIEVLEGTPAFDAGLLPGDVVVQVGNRQVRSLSGFRSALSAVFSREREAVLSLVRKGEPILVTLSR